MIRRCVVFSAAALVAGGCIYIFARDAGTTYLLPALLTRPAGDSSIGLFVGSLPTFLHVLAFSMLTVAAANPKSVHACIAIACGWCATNILMEIGQHSQVAPIIVDAVPAAFASVPLLENLAPYFLNGTFDSADLVAAALGAVAAVGVVLWLRNLEKNHESA